MVDLEQHIVMRNIRLIVVDSIASLVRAASAETAEDRKRNNEVLGRQAAVLKRYAENFNIPVFTVNQVA